MLLKVTLCCLALVTLTVTAVAANDDELATFKSFGKPFSADLVLTVRQELLKRIDSIWVNHPASTVCGNCLISSWAVNTGTSVGRIFQVSQIDSALAGLPSDVVDKVKSIAFANKVVFEMFRYSIPAQTANGHYLQYLGIARRSGTNVELALLKGEVVGRLVGKVVVHRYRTCGRILWWQCCCRDYSVNVPRGYYANEILMIETAMRAETVRRLRDRAQDISF